MSEPLIIQFVPQPDITAYELAQLLPLFWQEFYTEPPVTPELKRHLKIFNPNEVDPPRADQFPGTV